MSESAVTKPAPPPMLMDAGGLQLRSLDDAWRFAVSVVKSGLAPKGLDTPEKVLVALQTGMEAGLKPMASLRAVVVINGLPSWKGDQALALVRASGLLEGFGSEMAGEGEQQMATVWSTRRGGATARTEFAVKDAKRAGLWAKQGPWTQYPQRMLYYRALGFHLRDHYSDVLMGLPIAEEAQDFPSPERDVTPTAQLPAPTETDPIFDEPREPVEVDPDTGEVIPPEVGREQGALL